MINVRRRAVIVSTVNTSKEGKELYVETTAAITMSLGDTGLTTIQLVEGKNTITIEALNVLAGTNYTSFAEHEFASLSFSDKSKLINFDGNGLRIASLENSFKDAENMLTCKGIIINAEGSSNGSCNSAFKATKKATYIQISGNPKQFQQTFNNCGYNLSGAARATIDLSNVDTRLASGGMLMAFYYSKAEIIIGEKFTCTSASAAFSANNNKVYIISEEPPQLSGDIMVGTTRNGTAIDWVASLVSVCSTAEIYVPNTTAYLANNDWSVYSERLRTM